MNNLSFVFLKNLLDRNYYTNYSNIDTNEINNTMLTILALVSKYRKKAFEDEVINISRI